MKLLRDFIVQFSIYIATLVIGTVVFGIPAAYFGWWFWPAIGVITFVVLIVATIFSSYDNRVRKQQRLDGERSCSQG